MKLKSSMRQNLFFRKGGNQNMKLSIWDKVFNGVQLIYKAYCVQFD